MSPCQTACCLSLRIILGNRRDRQNRALQTVAKCTYSKIWLRNDIDGLLYSCLFSKWIEWAANFCGFDNFTDYSTAREAYKRKGVLVKHDTTQGRHFKTVSMGHFVIPTLAVFEIRTGMFWLVNPPNVPIPLDENQHLRRVRVASVIGYFNNLLVIQLNVTWNRHQSIVHFYSTKTSHSIGYSVIEQQHRQWLECHISPQNHRILLRPIHVTRLTNRLDSYTIELTNFDHEDDRFDVQLIPPEFTAHVFTFNAHLGDNHILCALDNVIYKQQLNNSRLSVDDAAVSYALDTPGSIHQIRSSPSGDFIAVRSVNDIHSKKYQSNIVSVIHYKTMSVILNINARGGYWPGSEVINLQVFPKFSLNEESIAVMRNHSTKRKVYVYRLPSTKVRSLQQLCACVLDHIRAANYDINIPHLLKQALETPTNQITTADSD